MFNELTLDHRHVKYQSVINSSWFIGFDKLGNPISGQELIKREVADAAQLDEAIGRERCYQFTKMNRLATSTQFFPESLELLRRQGEAAGSAARRQRAEGAERELAIYEAALAAARRPKTGAVATFSQAELINMARFRNILRYQLGRAAGQPVLDERPAARQAAGPRKSPAKRRPSGKGRSAAGETASASARPVTGVSRQRRGPPSESGDRPSWVQRPEEQVRAATGQSDHEEKAAHSKQVADGEGGPAWAAQLDEQAAFEIGAAALAA